MGDCAPFTGKSQSVEHGTPQEVLVELASWVGGFDLDVAASKELHVVDNYYTAEVDGLIQPWVGRCYCNCPYGREEGLWVSRGREAVLDGTAEAVVFLLPAKTGKRWWQDLVAQDTGEPGVYALRYPVERVKFFPGRLCYVGNDGGATFPSVAVLMRDYRYCGWDHGLNRYVQQLTLRFEEGDDD